MKLSDPQDQQFHENLLKLKGQRPAVTPSHEIRARCLETLEHGDQPHRTIVFKKYRKPALLSTIGIAASIAIAASIFYPIGNGANVDAAVIVEKLGKQIEDNSLIEITIESVVIDEVEIEGHLQIANHAIAGDIDISVEERKGQAIQVKASLAISEEGGWILIRELQFPDPQIQAILNLFLPQGVDTLLILPTDEIENAIGFELSEGLSEIRSLASGEVVKILKQVIESQDEVGATVRNQRDGTIQLTLPIDDAEALENLIKVIADAMGEKIDAHDIDIEDDMELLGCTFSVTYDPEEETVRSFSITDFGDENGTINVSLLEGDIDDELLDSDRVTTPSTRVLDLSALISTVSSLEDMIGNFDHSHRKKSTLSDDDEDDRPRKKRKRWN